MIIHTTNYKLRTFEKTDIDEFYCMVHEEEIAKYVKYVYCNNRHDARLAVSDYMNGDCKNDFYLLIEKDGVLVGCIVAIKLKEDTLDICWCIRVGYRGQGIMLEALTAFIQWLKTNTQYKYLDAIINIYNESSLRLVKKIEGNFCYLQKHDNCYYRINL